MRLGIVFPVHGWREGGAVEARMPHRNHVPTIQGVLRGEDVLDDYGVDDQFLRCVEFSKTNALVNATKTLRFQTKVRQNKQLFPKFRNFKIISKFPPKSNEFQNRVSFLPGIFRFDCKDLPQ